MAPQENEIYAYIDALEKKQAETNNKNAELSESIQASAFGNTDDKTIIHYQLEADRLKELVEHKLRGDVPKTDALGNTIWVKQQNEDFRPLNDLGVSGVMYTISMYVDKSTFLSYMDEERMYQMLFTLGSNLNDFFYINLTSIGLDTPEKQSKYPLLIKSILDVVEFSIRRAIGGKERESMNSKNINVNQGQGQNNQMLMSPQRVQKFNVFDPKTY